MGLTITEVTPGATELLVEWAAIRTETEGEISPDDPPAVPAELADDVFVPREHVRYRAWLAHLDGEPAGELVMVFDTEPSNRHLASFEWLAVRPSVRCHGVGTALARLGLDAAADDDRTSVMVWMAVDHPAKPELYCVRMGLTHRTTDRCSRVRVADIDRDLMRRWVDDAVAPSLGYRLVQYQDRCPDEYFDALVQAMSAMDDIPTDELEWTVPEYKANDVRTRQERLLAQSCTTATTLVLAPDGSGAGFSELIVSRHRPQLAHQGDTGVVVAHRGHALGRWIKAANLAWGETAIGDFDVIETDNAESNPWMLDINVAMGFRPHAGFACYQGDVATARAALG